MPPFLVDLAANLGTKAANFVKMAANQDLTYAAEGSLIRNMRGSILPDSLNVRATGKEVESCALRY